MLLASRLSLYYLLRYWRRLHLNRVLGDLCVLLVPLRSFWVLCRYAVRSPGRNVDLHSSYSVVSFGGCIGACIRITEEPQTIRAVLI